MFVFIFASNIYSLSRPSIIFSSLQLPEKIHSRELVPLAQLFSPSTLEMVALEYFRISQAVVSTLKAVHRENIEAFKRGLIRIFIYKGHNRKVTPAEMSSTRGNLQ